MNEFQSFMKTTPLYFLSFALLALSGANAKAQNMTVDAGNSHTVVFMGDNQTFERNGNGKDIAVTGSGNKVIIHGECGSFSVTGSNNSVSLDRVRRVSYLGEGNGDKPSFNSVGSDNNLSRRQETHEASRPTDKDESASALTFEKTGGERRSENVSDKDVIVNSGGNDLTLTGSVRSLTINSAGNHIELEKVKAIVFNGTGNHVTYSTKKNGGPPSVTDNGHGNVVEGTE
jgi:hypothetical protein